ncbi:phage tail tape measure protein [Variovorax sp. KBS0712]|uniref:phage tail tape measure protein n=1 Tax=Variovorax sp. KBS0712 TaxID=2578111 RepID=UPI00111A3577|nr:phage tail tape measure protein [Variovorax sp. KBS0712]TSD59020.1 phage tail tape measure protein [Variovorax sp. KBS0712]
MTDLKKQIVMGVDASGVEAGGVRVKRTLSDIGVHAQAEGKKAAEGIAAIGKGSDEAASKVDTNTKSLINSIQRATAAAEAGKKSGSEYFASLASQRGVNTDALKPYLAQLDLALSKQKALQDDQRRIGDGFGALGIRPNSAIVDEAKKIREAFNQIRATGVADEVERARSVVASKMAALRAEFDSAGKSGAAAFSRMGISAAQTSAALRGVPAQVTDIVTSLQGGQAPLTVFLQQGGQLKDMFGGIGPAASALGSYIGGMITPVSLAAAGVAALAFAYYQATERNQEFNKALIASGNYAGQSASQLDSMSQRIAGIIGTQGQATDALLALASSGRIAGSVMESVGTAVVAQTKVMGTSVKDAVEEYVRLGEEPTKASAKLNESLHYLTLSTFDQIRALEEEGRKEEAAALAQATRAEASVAAMQKVQAQAGLLSKALSLTRDVAAGMWSAIANGVASIGAQQSAADRLMDAQKRVAFLNQNGSTPEALRKAKDDVVSASRELLREQETTAAEGERKRTEQAQIAASQRLADQKKETRTRAEQRKEEIEQLDRDAKLVNLKAEDYARLRANIEEKYKDKKQPKGSAPKAYQDDAATKMLENLRQTEASLQSQLDGELKITDAQKKQVEFTKLVADLKEKSILTAEQRSLLANKDAIGAQLEKNAALSGQLEFEKKIADIVKKSADDAKQYRQQMDGIYASIASGQESRDEQSTRELGAFGLGRRAREEVEAQRAIRAEFQRYERGATKSASENGTLFSQKYRDDVERIKKALEEALDAQGRYFDALKVKQADWKTGATAALSDYADAVANVSATAEKAFADGFKSAEDSLVQFVTKGKVDVKSLADSIIADFARVGIQQTITGPMAKGLAGLFQGDELGDLLKSRGLAGGGGGEGGLDWSKLFSTVGGWFSGKGFADGGSPPVGKASIVGERGPELFVPSVPGTIVPNHALAGGGGPLSITINNTVGDVATLSMLKQAQQGTERRIAAAFGRSRAYGGAA